MQNILACFRDNHKTSKDIKYLKVILINRNLEALARQLYDYWFVQFDFPDENGRPYKSSGGKMVWDEKLKREIPESWEIISLEDIEQDIVTGKTPSTSIEEYFGGNIPFVTIDDIRGNLYVLESERSLTDKGADTQKNKYIEEGSLMCSCIGTVGVLGFAGRRLQTNQQINSIKFSKIENSFFLLFALNRFFSVADAKKGNILPNMSKQEFGKIPILYPANHVLKNFYQKLRSIFYEIFKNTKEISKLIKLRNSILPLLMNGQVSVKPTELNCDLSLYQLLSFLHH